VIKKFVHNRTGGLKGPPQKKVSGKEAAERGKKRDSSTRDLNRGNEPGLRNFEQRSKTR